MPEAKLHRQFKVPPTASPPRATAQGVQAYIMSAIYCQQGASDFRGKTSNDALGVKTVSLEQAVKEAVERSKANATH
ncbi:unnamed protein product [Adineta steineri]|uniref:Uncharacterized protein n=1 Tax=Adineta steineri TaxID=433720 RepID=A0A815AJ56_9BILA|nr:unnamed protein product [Adineta steineri]